MRRRSSYVAGRGRTAGSDANRDHKLQSDAAEDGHQQMPDRLFQVVRDVLESKRLPVGDLDEG